MFANNLLTIAKRYCEENCPDSAPCDQVQTIDSESDENFSDPLLITTKELNRCNLTQASILASGLSTTVVESPTVTDRHTVDYKVDTVPVATATPVVVQPEASSSNTFQNEPPPAIHITGGTVYFNSGRQDHSLSPVKASSPIPMNPSKKRKLELVEEMTEKMMSIVSQTFSAILETDENTHREACGKMSSLSSLRK